MVSDSHRDRRASGLERYRRHFDEHDVGPLSGTVLEWNSLPQHRVRFTWDEDTITFELTPATGGADRLPSCA